MRGFPGCSLKILYLLKLYSYMVLNLVVQSSVPDICVCCLQGLMIGWLFYKDSRMLRVFWWSFFKKRICTIIPLVPDLPFWRCTLFSKMGDRVWSSLKLIKMVASHGFSKLAVFARLPWYVTHAKMEENMHFQIGSSLPMPKWRFPNR